MARSFMTCVRVGLNSWGCTDGTSRPASSSRSLASSQARKSGSFSRSWKWRGKCWVMVASLIDRARSPDSS